MKPNSSRWDTPVEDYEAAVRRLVDAIYHDPAWISDISTFVFSLHPADWHKCLAQMLLKLTVPGVPDLYQGTELWTLTLCDPTIAAGGLRPSAGLAGGARPAQPVPDPRAH